MKTTTTMLILIAVMMAIVLHGARQIAKPINTVMAAAVVASR